MTDKQIIIDGVEVSGCAYLDNIDFDELCLMLSSPYECQVNCSNKPNCYYKQLKRKEQELQEAMDNYVQLDLQRVKEYNELVDLYKAKDQECEELQNKFLELNGKSYSNSLELDQLKQTLTKIKEIAEHCIKQDICTTCDYSEKCHIEDEEISTYDVCKLILQKISECEAENG